MLLRIFGIVFPVFAIVSIGYVYGRLRRPDLSVVNALNMAVLVPALIFGVLSSREFEIGRYGALAFAALAVVLGSGLLAWPVARMTGIAAKTFVPPMMFTNAGNMGLPLAVFAFGEQALPAAVVLLVVENGLHFTLGTWLMDRRAHWLDVLRQPIALATLAGIVFAFGGWGLPRPLMAAIDMLGQASIPLLLFSLGARLTAIDLRDWRPGVLGAIVCPLSGALMVLMLLPWLELSAPQQGMLIMFGALPPAVLNYLVAERYRQEPARVASIVLFGNLGAFIVMPFALVFALR
ncbi:MAG: AEC family transporter [Betaproteobacteria bacterium]|nr:AEC family transporter [Betaproteobacteria bacterium]